MSLQFNIFQGDALKLPLRDESVDLVMFSPPYCDARTYGIRAERRAEAWVEWMLQIVRESLWVSRGPVIVNCAGVTRDRNYWPACEGLLWEWYKSGGHSYRPCYWKRVGIPGSGMKDWFRADVEYCFCFKRPGPLAWANNTAMGHIPKYAPGGDPSHRTKSGRRVNAPAAKPERIGGRKIRTRAGVGRIEIGEGESESNGKAVKFPTRKNQDGIHGEKRVGAPRYKGVKLANPGNLIRIKTGGGLMGSKLAHESEAPYPEALAAWFIRGLCPPGGIVLDPFGGSGTTAAAANKCGRNAITCDIRPGAGGIATMIKRRAETREFLPLA